MSEATILVTGAAGGAGRTAGTLIRLLRAAHVPVRAFVHRTDTRSEALAQLGAEIHVGDMLDIVSVRAAMKGIEKIFFCYPVKDGFLEATAIAAQVGREAQVKFLVNLSQGSASDVNPSPATRKHWLAEQMFDWSGIPVFHLRAGVFFENIFWQFARGIVEQGQLRAPFGNGEGKIPLVAAQDVSRVALAALLNPNPFVGKALLIFSELLSLTEIARQTSEALKRPVSYHEISDEDWLKEAAVRIRLRNGSENTEVLNHLINLWKFLLARNLSDVETTMNAPDLILKLTGQPGQTLKSWLESEAFERILKASAVPSRAGSLATESPIS